MRTTNHLTEGPILRSLAALTVPIVFANILQTAYQLTDTFWVGRLGAEAVAAVSLSFPVVFLLISLGSGLGIAGTILVAQHRGRGDQRQVDYVSAQTVVMMLAASVVVTVVGYAVSGPAMRLMGAPTEVLRDATSYLQISFLGMVFMFGFFVYQSLMRGVGDVTTPMLIVLATVVLNLALDPLFIFGWGPVRPFGVAGAALATIGTQAVAMVIGFGLLAGGRHGIRVHLRDLAPDLALAGRMFRLGLPASIEQSTRALGLTAMVFLVATFPTTVVAAYGIGARILSFVIIPSLGLGMATTTLVGQNLGAGNVARAEHIARLSALAGMVVLSALGVAFFFAARPMTAFFVPGETAVIAEGARFMHLMALTFGFIGVQMVTSGTLRGAGATVSAMVLAIISLWVLRFPLAVILSKGTELGADGLWWAFPTSNVLAGLIATVWLLRGRWKHTRIAGVERRGSDLAAEVGE